MNKTDDILGVSFNLNARDLILSVLRGQNIADAVDDDLANLIFQRLVHTGAMGFVNSIGLQTTQPAFLAIYEDYVKFFKMHTMQANHMCIERSLKVSQALTAKGVEHVIVKGPMRQKQVYGDLFTRPSKDTDVLVAPRDFNAAIEALIASGYRSGFSGSRETWYKVFQGQLHMVEEGVKGWSIDLHKYLTTPQAANTTNHDLWFSDIDKHLIGATKHADAEIPIPNAMNANLVTVLNIVKSLHGRPAEQKTLSGWRRSTIVHVCDLYCQFRNSSAREQEDFLACAKAAGIESSALLALRVVQAVFDHKFAVLKTRRPVLDKISDDDLINIVLAPEHVSTWPTPHHLLLALSKGDPVKSVRQLMRYLSSVVARRLLAPIS